MVLLQEGIIGGPLLIGGALIAIIALILIIVFIVSLTKTSETKEETGTDELKTDEPANDSVRKAKGTDNIILIGILAIIGFFLIKFLYWLGNIKFD